MARQFVSMVAVIFVAIGATSCGTCGDATSPWDVRVADSNETGGDGGDGGDVPDGSPGDVADGSPDVPSDGRDGGDATGVPAVCRTYPEVDGTPLPGQGQSVAANGHDCWEPREEYAAQTPDMPDEEEFPHSPAGSPKIVWRVDMNEAVGEIFGEEEVGFLRAYGLVAGEVRAGRPFVEVTTAIETASEGESRVEVGGVRTQLPDGESGPIHAVGGGRIERELPNTAPPPVAVPDIGLVTSSFPLVPVDSRETERDRAGTLHFNFGFPAAGVNSPYASKAPPVGAANPDLVVTDDGRVAALWGSRRVVILGHRDPRREGGRPRFELQQSLGIRDIWQKVPEGARIAWLRYPASANLLVNIRTPGTEQGGSGRDHVFRIDRCGKTELVFEAPAVADEVMKTDGGYLTRVGNCEEPDAASRPTLYRDGEPVERLSDTCRDMVELQPRRFACLRQRDDGHWQIVEFTPNLEVVRRTRVPTGGDTFVDARLQMAVRGGIAVVLALHESEQSTRGRLVFVGPDTSARLDLPAEDYVPAPADIGTADTVLTDDGMLTMIWDDTLLGIQTEYRGLAPTRYPRPRYGGNGNRGYMADEQIQQ